MPAVRRQPDEHDDTLTTTDPSPRSKLAPAVLIEGVAVIVNRRVRQQSVGHAVYTCNVDHVMMLRENRDFARAYANASLVTADGAPVVALARLLGGPVSRRVTGADLVPALAAVAAERGLRLALVGGREGVADTAAGRLAAQHPGLSVVALPPPPHGFKIGGPEDERLLRQLEAVGPAIVIVCFGAPKQELWIERHRRRLVGTALLGAGASLDFIAGEQTRAPVLWQRFGLEFLWRLLTNWPRLWRRYLLRDSRFLRVVGEELLRRPTPAARSLPALRHERPGDFAASLPDLPRRWPNDAA